MGSAAGVSVTVFLFVAIAIALAFEFVNGFHDTANAVATVIYTHSLKPSRAVIWSGICNFIGVLCGGIAVAMSIVHLLPVELLVQKGNVISIITILSLLGSALIWNLGTWYLGLPSSSSHTLIGSILGVGLAHSMTAGHRFGEGVNWDKAKSIGISLLVSPVVGFVAAGLGVLVIRRFFYNQKLFRAPVTNESPPWGIRALLIATCGGVSFAHGSNDGQKGIGLLMLILIGLAPTNYAINTQLTAAELNSAIQGVQSIETAVQELNDHEPSRSWEVSAVAKNQIHTLAKSLDQSLQNWAREGSAPANARWNLRVQTLLLEKEMKSLLQRGQSLDALERQKLTIGLQALNPLTAYAPIWVMLLVALALGSGTMIGWKRIVVTVGEKIGKSHLTFVQGAVSEVVAMTTIGIAALSGLPVSTTHVLSSGIAGAMVAQKSGIQKGTVTKILWAWVLTLPASMLISLVLFHLMRWTISTG